MRERRGSGLYFPGFFRFAFFLPAASAFRRSGTSLAVASAALFPTWGNFST